MTCAPFARESIDDTVDRLGRGRVDGLEELSQFRNLDERTGGAKAQATDTLDSDIGEPSLCHSLAQGIENSLCLQRHAAGGLTDIGASPNGTLCRAGFLTLSNVGHDLSPSRMRSTPSGVTPALHAAVHHDRRSHAAGPKATGVQRTRVRPHWSRPALCPVGHVSDQGAPKRD